MAEQFHRVGEAADHTFLGGDDLYAVSPDELRPILRRNYTRTLSANVSCLIRCGSHHHYRTFHRGLLHRAEVRSVGILNLRDQESQQDKKVQVFYFVIHFVFNIVSSVLNIKYN